MNEVIFDNPGIEGLELLGRGKVRDLYALGADLLLVATDRISAFDVVLPAPIPDKGKVLTTVSSFWFKMLAPLCQHHLISNDVGQWDDLPAGAADALRHRTMRVHRVKPLPVEFVVRGYLTGSGWQEYQERGSVCGVELPTGLLHAAKLPEPILTPTTKAHDGHDEPIDFATMAATIGDDLANRTRDLSLELYGKALEFARKRGFVLADTKLEFGLGKEDELVLIDEIFTPDSSRFWPSEMVEPGGKPPSFDKQVMRDWLSESGWDKNPPAPELPMDVIEKTAHTYRELCARLTGLDCTGKPAAKNA